MWPVIAYAIGISMGAMIGYSIAALIYGKAAEKQRKDHAEECCRDEDVIRNLGQQVDFWRNSHDTLLGEKHLAENRASEQKDRHRQTLAMIEQLRHNVMAEDGIVETQTEEETGQ